MLGRLGQVLKIGGYMLVIYGLTVEAIHFIIPLVFQSPNSEGYLASVARLQSGVTSFGISSGYMVVIGAVIGAIGYVVTPKAKA